MKKYFEEPLSESSGGILSGRNGDAKILIGDLPSGVYYAVDHISPVIYLIPCFLTQQMIENIS